MTSTEFLSAAQWLANRGMHVFPLRPGTKVPAVRSDWEGCATTDPQQIQRWWAGTRYNIGIATGRSGLVVVDLDVAAPDSSSDERTGRVELDELARNSGATVPHRTMTVATPSGGEHLYFRAREGLRLLNSVGLLGGKIDTRAAGGYVVAPGSRIGHRSYRLTRIEDPLLLPSWLVAMLLPPDRPIQRPDNARQPAHPAYVRAAVVGEGRRVADALVGQRNHALFLAAARLARFVVTGQLTDADVHAALAAAADAHVGTEGFTASEVRRTVQSGLRAGQASSSRSAAALRQAAASRRPGRSAQH